MKTILKHMKGFGLLSVVAVFFVLVNNIAQLVLPMLMSRIVNDGIQRESIDTIYSVGVLMLIVALVGGGTAILSNYFSSKVSTLFGANLRSAVFRKVQNLAQEDMDDIGVSSLITRSTNDIRQIEDFILTSLRMLITIPIMLFGGAFMAIRMNKQLSFIIFIFLPLIGIAAYLVIRKVMPWFTEMQERTDGMNQIVRERLSGVRVIRAFNQNKREEDRFKDANDKLTDLMLKTQRFFAVMYPAVMILLSLLVVLLTWVASSQINAMDAVTQSVEIENTIGNLQAFVLYAVMIITAIGVTAAMFIMVPRANISAKRVAEVLDKESTILFPETDKKRDDANDKKGVLEFDNVSFGYKSADERIIKDVSFTSRPGEVTAIIGGTGSGKSSLVNLIPRFYDVTGGSVSIGGQDIRDMTLDSLNSKLGYIPQRALLFSGSVADNLRYGKTDATEDEMWNALRLAQAEDFVRALPDGLESHVSQEATNLSGGQKQRLSIARALIKNTEIYIFDDSFSALDFRTDARLRRVLRSEITWANIIIVAQRVGTILDADRIIVLENGEVRGVGTHKELLQDSDVYREIVYSQLTQEELE